MSGQLTDDGTMATVIRCSECGAEQRYSFDVTGRDESDFQAKVEDNMRDLRLSRAQAEEDIARLNYDAFVDWAIEDFDDSHECPTYSVQTWFERDRAHVALYYGTNQDANDDLIVEWWDGAVAEAVEDGFLDPRDYLSSAIEYAESVGFTPKGKR